MRKYSRDYFTGSAITLIGMGVTTTGLYLLSEVDPWTNETNVNNLAKPLMIFGSILSLTGCITMVVSHNHMNIAGKVLELEMNVTGGKIKYTF